MKNTKNKKTSIFPFDSMWNGISTQHIMFVSVCIRIKKIDINRDIVNVRANSKNEKKKAYDTTMMS